MGLLDEALNDSKGKKNNKKKDNGILKDLYNGNLDDIFDEDEEDEKQIDVKEILNEINDKENKDNKKSKKKNRRNYKRQKMNKNQKNTSTSTWNDVEQVEKTKKKSKNKKKEKGREKDKEELAMDYLKEKYGIESEEELNKVLNNNKDDKKSKKKKSKKNKKKDNDSLIEDDEVIMCKKVLDYMRGEINSFKLSSKDNITKVSYSLSEDVFWVEVQTEKNMKVFDGKVKEENLKDILEFINDIFKDDLSHINDLSDIDYIRQSYIVMDESSVLQKDNKSLTFDLGIEEEEEYEEDEEDDEEEYEDDEEDDEEEYIEEEEEYEDDEEDDEEEEYIEENDNENDNEENNNKTKCFYCMGDGCEECNHEGYINKKTGD